MCEIVLWARGGTKRNTKLLGTCIYGMLALILDSHTVLKRSRLGLRKMGSSVHDEFSSRAQASRTQANCDRVKKRVVFSGRHV